jgi:hypothetical protein
MAHAPRRACAYQPKVPPWEQRPTRPRVLKERRKSVNAARGRDQPICWRSFRTHSRFPGCFQGCTLRWYASNRWGVAHVFMWGVRIQIGTHVEESMVDWSRKEYGRSTLYETGQDVGDLLLRTETGR